VLGATAASKGRFGAGGPYGRTNCHPAPGLVQAPLALICHRQAPPRCPGPDGHFRRRRYLHRRHRRTARPPADRRRSTPVGIRRAALRTLAPSNMWRAAEVVGTVGDRYPDLPDGRELNDRWQAVTDGGGTDSGPRASGCRHGAPGPSPRSGRGHHGGVRRGSAVLPRHGHGAGVESLATAVSCPASGCPAGLRVGRILGMPRRVTQRRNKTIATTTDAAGSRLPSRM
jgi:hypothetical protein